MSSRSGLTETSLGAKPGQKNLLTPRRRGTPRPASGILAATMAELPEPDGATIAIVGLTHSLLPSPTGQCAVLLAAFRIERRGMA